MDVIRLLSFQTKHSFKVVRSQLGQYNAYYPPVSEKEENAEEENAGWVPLESSKHGKWSELFSTEQTFERSQKVDMFPFDPKTFPS